MTAVTGTATGSAGSTGSTGQVGKGKDDSGGGDEEAARTPVRITLKRGGLKASSRRVYRVPPFIAIELSVVATDGRTYTANISGPGKQPGPQLIVRGFENRSGTLAGLRSGEVYTVKIKPKNVIVRIKANADPGP